MGRVKLTAIKKKSAVTLAAATGRLLQRTVKISTNATYASHINTMEKMLAQLRKVKRADVLTITKAEMLELLVTLEEQGVGSGPSFLSALRKRGLCAGIDLTHLDDPAVDAAARAVRRVAKAASKPCGTLTPEQFDQLKEYLKTTDDTELYYACVIAYRARLRIGELYEIRKGDLLTEAGVSFLRLRAWKQGETDVNPEPKLVPASLRAAIAACAAYKFGDDGRLFSRGIDGRLRNMMPTWARKLEWPDALRYNGPHVFRHGGSQSLDGLASKVGRTVLAIVAQQSMSTFTSYARPLASRLKRKTSERREEK